MSRLIYISLLLVFVLLYKTQADAQQAVFHNSGAQIVITKGADVNVQGSMLSEPSNNIAPKIQLNGNLSISGDIINHSDNLFRISEGYLILTGSGTQVISSNSSSPFLVYNLELNGTGTTLLQTNVRIINDLNFQQGYLDVGDQDLVLYSNAFTSGTPGNQSMIITSGTGRLIKSMTQQEDITLPVGSTAKGAHYSPVDIAWKSGNFYSNSLVMLSVKPEKLDANTSPQNYLEKYWDVQISDVDNPKADLTFHYAPEEVFGDSSRIYAMRFFENNGQMWPRFDGEINPVTHSFTFNTSNFGKFTAGDLGTADFSDVIVFPNPNNGAFSIKVIAPAEGLMDMQFTNMAGQLIYAGQIDQGIHEYDFTNSPKGVYFVKIFFSNKIVTRKIVIR